MPRTTEELPKEVKNILKLPESEFVSDCLMARKNGVEGRIVRRENIFDQLGFKEGARSYDVYNENDCYTGDFTVCPKERLISEDEKKKAHEYLIKRAQQTEEQNNA
ncbi:MAG: hypothetical protein V3V81_07520 [Candidatus Bathyarchaeia archaeon]